MMKKFMYCPVCEKEHEVELVEQPAEVEIKGQKVSYKETVYRCSNAKEDNEFVNGKMMDRNLLNARNAYRKKNHLLTSDDIVKTRQKYGLTQSELSDLLGWGGATVARYESKAIQDRAHDSILRNIKENPMEVYRYLKENKKAFSVLRFEEIKERITECLADNEYLERELLTSDYIPYSKKSDSNGFCVLDIDKLEQVISYLASQDETLSKTRLMKELWYADSLSFKQRNHAITGLVYAHQKYGALAKGHIVNLKNVISEVQDLPDGREMVHIKPNPLLGERKLSKEDKQILDAVSKKFSKMSTEKLVEYMHKEKAYKETKTGDLISFQYAKELNGF